MTPILPAAPLSLNLRDRARHSYDNESRTAPLRWMTVPLPTRPSLSRTRLQTLPFFCLSVSGRKLAPSAPSLKRVSRTESGQLASGWHDSSPFPDRPAERLHVYAPHHCRVIVRYFAVATMAIRRTSFAKDDSEPRGGAQDRRTHPLRGTGECRCHGSRLAARRWPRIHALEWRARYQAVVHRFPGDRRRATTSQSDRHHRDHPHLRRRRRHPRHGEGHGGRQGPATRSDLHIGYTDVWVWKDGRWQMTAWRSARLPDSRVSRHAPVK